MLEVEAGIIKDREARWQLEHPVQSPSLVFSPFQFFFKLFDSVLQLDFGLLGCFQFTLQYLLLS